MYGFYVNQFGGTSISQEAFPELERRARDRLRRYERVYRVEGDETARKMAICAMAEAMDYFDSARNGKGGLRYASVGTVSVSGKGLYGSLDISPTAEERELYRCAGEYLDICRAAVRPANACPGWVD